MCSVWASQITNIVHCVSKNDTDVAHYNFNVQDAPIKNNPLEKMLYFSHGSMDLSQTFKFFYVSIHTRYPANFIEITGIVSQI